MVCTDSPLKHGFTFTPSLSIYVECESETELETVFEQLSAGGQVLVPLDNYGFSQSGTRIGRYWKRCSDSNHHANLFSTAGIGIYARQLNY
jgi:predicted 3-demethylubiquinone-9 3-methyltransferase (glyoxalase superfamily)